MTGEVFENSALDPHITPYIPTPSASAAPWCPISPSTFAALPHRTGPEHDEWFSRHRLPRRALLYISAQRISRVGSRLVGKLLPATAPATRVAIPVAAACCKPATTVTVGRV
uniref:Uncharacterized protein n=1 Tax=Setaria italica TaxID=4555 RepID=K3ZKD6_SETIT